MDTWHRLKRDIPINDFFQCECYKNTWPSQCKIAEELGICVHELCADEECYAVSVPKDTLAKLIVVSEINDVELEELINCILEKGIGEHGFSF